MLLSVIDTETTGIDPTVDKIIEIGGLLYDVSSKTVIQQFSTLLPVSDNPSESHNGISADISKAYSADLSMLKNFLSACDAVIGHNFKEFDKKFLELDLGILIEKEILDTLTDFIFPLSKPKSKRLTDIALDHGIPVYKPHRALYDCQLIAEIFDRYSVEELEKLIEVAREEKFLYYSTEGYPGTLSKEQGFRFNDEVPKKWSKRLREKDAMEMPFGVIRVS